MNFTSYFHHSHDKPNHTSLSSTLDIHHYHHNAKKNRHHHHHTHMHATTDHGLTLDNVELDTVQPQLPTTTSTQQEQDQGCVECPSKCTDCQCCECWNRYKHQYQDCATDRSRILCLTLTTLIGASIVLGIYFGSIYPTVLDKRAVVHTTCQTESLLITPSRCCRSFGCVCAACSASAVSCDTDALQHQPLNSSQCCGGSCCSRQCCDTCFHSCPHRTCDLDGQNCQTSYSPCEPYSCNCRCCSGYTIPAQACSFQCGTCHTLLLRYHTHDYPALSLTTTFECELDDHLCVTNYEALYQSDQPPWPCWYDERDPSHVSFGGTPRWNVAALVFFYFFLVITVMCILLVWIPLLLFGFQDVCTGTSQLSCGCKILS